VPLIDFCYRNDSRTRLKGARDLALTPKGREQGARRLTGQVVSAQGLALYRESEATASTTARPCSFYPNLIGPDTSCRERMHALNWTDQRARRAVTASPRGESLTRHSGQAGVP
jgi:hypothetical protein